jgi:glycosyltransferase involved in cell wall biosynthesis
MAGSLMSSAYSFDRVALQLHRIADRLLINRLPPRLQQRIRKRLARAAWLLHDAAVTKDQLIVTGRLSYKNSSVALYGSEKLGTPGKRKVLFVGHEASRTGAPLIMLQMVRAFVGEGEIEPVVWLLGGGPLGKEYSALAITLDGQGDVSNQVADNLGGFLASFAEPIPDVVVFNSANCKDMAARLAPHFRRRLFFVHERMTHYATDDPHRIHQIADVIIYPSQLMCDISLGYQARQRFADRGNSIVLGQGFVMDVPKKLLSAKQKITSRRKLGLDPHAFYVVGCGNADLRKGIDDFVHAALLAALKHPDKNIHFIWIGNIDAIDSKAWRWLNYDLDMVRKPQNMSFLGEVKRPVDVMALCDVFFLSSRDDPFPCVVQEAMAAGLPVFCYKDATGSEEIAVAGGGMSFQYRAVHDVVDAIADLFVAPHELASRRAMSFAFAHENFDPAVYHSRIKALLDQPTP